MGRIVPSRAPDPLPGCPVVGKHARKQEPPRQRWKTGALSRLPARLVTAGVAGALALGGGVWAFADQGPEPPRTTAEPREQAECERTVALDITADPSIAPAMRQLVPVLADRHGPAAPVCVDATVQDAPSARVLSQLTDPDTEPEHLPDLWIPDSSRWVALAAETENGARRVAGGDTPLVALSPVVVAMKPGDAERLGADKPYFGWPQLRAAQEKEGADNLRLALPDPARSAAGMTALQAVVEKTRLGNVFTPEALAALRMPLIVDNNVERPLAGVAAGDLQGMATSERELLIHNARGAGEDLMGVRVGRESLGLALDYRLVPISRSGELSETDLADAARSIAAVLESPPGHEALEGVNLRPASGTPLPASTPVGIRTAALEPPRSAVDGISELMKAWAHAGRRGGVLLMFDVSGSMAQQVPGTGANKLTLAIAGARRALTVLGPDSDMALWSFSTELDGSKDHRKLLANSALAARQGGVTHRDIARRVLNDLRVKKGGSTGLYDSTLAAFRAAQRAYSPGRLNAVVLLTDGRNEDANSISRSGLLRTLRDEADEQRPVRIITIGYGADADASVLRDIAGVTGGRSYLSKDPADIDKVLIEALTTL